MSAKDQVLELVNKFEKENFLRDKTDAMGEGLLLGANLADDANERSKEATETTLAVQEKYKEQILAQDLNPNKDPELVDLRNGNQTAGERIAKFENSTITQLSQMLINVKMFGAKGDGITDDTETIQAALDFIHSKGGGTLYLPKGIYRYSNRLLLGDKTRFRGDGIGVTILKLVDNVDLERITIGTDVSTGKARYECSFTWKSGTGFYEFGGFYDLTIDGNSQNNRHWHHGGKDYTAWSGDDFEDFNWIQGIQFDTTPRSDCQIPKDIIINNVEIKNTVRNGLVGKVNKSLIVNNLIVENSDADHLLYVQSPYGSKAVFNNLVLKGYGREGLIKSFGCNFNNITFQDLIENPTGFEYVTLFVTPPPRVGFEMHNQFSNVDVDINIGEFIHTSDLSIFTNGDFGVTNLTIIFHGSNSAYAALATDVRTFTIVSTYHGTNGEELRRGQITNINVKNAPSTFRLSQLNSQITQLIFDKGVITHLNSTVAYVGKLANVSLNSEAKKIIFNDIHMDVCPIPIMVTSGGNKVESIDIINSWLGTSSQYNLIEGVFANLGDKTVKFDNTYVINLLSTQRAAIEYGRIYTTVNGKKINATEKVKRGRSSFVTATTVSTVTVDVVFNVPMQSADYSVSVMPEGGNTVHAYFYGISNQSKTGFTVNVMSKDGNNFTIGTTRPFNWSAISSQ